jgi:hypothetical protein
MSVIAPEDMPMVMPPMAKKHMMKATRNIPG